VQRRAAGPRRLTEWIGSADSDYLAIAGGASVIIQSFTNDTSLLSARSTVVRTRGLFSIHPTAYTADLVAIGAVGFAMVTDEAFTAGAASIPGPWTEQEWDGWFVWFPFAFRFELLDGTGAMMPGSLQIPFDSKAQRKFDQGMTIVVMVETQQAGAAVTVATPFRMLFKLA